MPRHTATFEIDSPSDARTISRVLDDLHNRLREEDLRVREGESAVTRMLEEFRDLQEEVDSGSTGRLVVTYESDAGE